MPKLPLVDLGKGDRFRVRVGGRFFLVCCDCEAYSRAEKGPSRPRFREFFLTRRPALRMLSGMLHFRGATTMPKGSKVHKVYKALRRGGAGKGKAARIAQSQTGQALKTGKPPKKRRRSKRGKP